MMPMSGRSAEIYSRTAYHPSPANLTSYEICSSIIEQLLQKCAVDEIENLIEQASTSKSWQESSIP